MRRGDKTPDDLDRPDGNSLKENYELHDIGHAEAVTRLEAQGYTVEEWGIDRRHDDGEEGIIFDDAMDFKVYWDGELVALLDVKTKSSPQWMGRFNARHYDHYKEHAETFDVPSFVVMFQISPDAKSGDSGVSGEAEDAKFQVDGDDNIHDEFVVNVGSCAPHRSGDDTKAVYSFPDGNEAVLIPHTNRHSWSVLEWALDQQITDEP